MTNDKADVIQLRISKYTWLCLKMKIELLYWEDFRKIISCKWMLFTGSIFMHNVLINKGTIIVGHCIIMYTVRCIIKDLRIIELALKELYQTPLWVWISVLDSTLSNTHFKEWQKITKIVKKKKKKHVFNFYWISTFFLDSWPPYDLHSSLNFSHLSQYFATPPNPESISIPCIWLNWDLKQDWNNFPLPLYSYTPSQNIPELS